MTKIAESSKSSHNKTAYNASDNRQPATSQRQRDRRNHRTKRKMQHASACIKEIRWSWYQGNDGISGPILTPSRCASADCYGEQPHSHWPSVPAVSVLGAATTGKNDNWFIQVMVNDIIYNSVFSRGLTLQVFVLESSGEGRYPCVPDKCSVVFTTACAEYF